MNLKASIIIPSIRFGTVRVCIDRINETSKGIPYEIIVVSPEELKLEGYLNVKFIKENKKQGNLEAERIAEKVAQGEYLMPIGDYFLFEKDCLKNMIEFCDSKPDIMILTSPKIHGFWCVQPECTVFGKYYPRLPFIHRKWLNKIGGLVDNRFKYNHGDVDLAMRVYKNGGKVLPCPNAYTEVFDPTTEDINSKLLPQNDGILFSKLWSCYSMLKDIPCFYNPNEISHELSHRIYIKISLKQWNSLLEDFNKDFTVSKRFFPWLLSYVLLFWEDIPKELRPLLLEKILSVAERGHYWLFYSLFNNQLAGRFDNIDANSRILSLIVASMLLYRINELLGRKHILIESFYGKVCYSWEELKKAVVESAQWRVVDRVNKYIDMIRSKNTIEELSKINWGIDRNNYEKTT